MLTTSNLLTAPHSVCADEEPSGDTMGSQNLLHPRYPFSLLQNIAPGARIG